MSLANKIERWHREVAVANVVLVNYIIQKMGSKRGLSDYATTLERVAKEIRQALK